MRKKTVNVSLGENEYRVLKEVADELDLKLSTLIRLVMVNIIRSGDLGKYIRYRKRE